MKNLELTVTFDNWKTVSLGKLDYEKVTLIETLCNELHLRNAVRLNLNGGMMCSYPEHHSGTFQGARQQGGGPMKGYAIEVRKTGRTFGVFGITFTGDGGELSAELIEGGFFTRPAADACREQWERECVQSEVEDAERRAGWDPNP